MEVVLVIKTINIWQVKKFSITWLVLNQGLCNILFDDPVKLMRIKYARMFD
jgi:hypothetical protein